MKNRTDEHLPRILSRIISEAEERKKRLRSYLEQLRSQQQQILGVFDSRIDAMIKRRIQAIMDRLDGLLRNRNGSRNRDAHPREASGEPIVNFSKHSNRRRTYGSTRGRSNPSSGATGSNRPRNPSNIRRGSTGIRPKSNEPPTRGEYANRRLDCSVDMNNHMGYT